MSEAAVETPAGDEMALAGSFEPTAEGEEADVPTYFSGPASAEPEATVEGEGAATEPVEPVAETAPADFRSSPEIADFIRSEVEALVAAQTQGQQEPETEAAPEYELDPLDDNFGQNLTSAIKDIVQEAVKPIAGPLAQQQQEQQAHAAQEAVKDVIASVDVGGDFNKDLAAELFYTYKDAAVQKYGVTNRAAEYAAEQAARRVRAIEADAEKRGVERYKNELATLGGAPRDTGAATQGVRAQQFSDGDEMSVAARWKT